MPRKKQKTTEEQPHPDFSDSLASSSSGMTGGMTSSTAASSSGATGDTEEEIAAAHAEWTSDDERDFQGTFEQLIVELRNAFDRVEKELQAKR